MGTGITGAFAINVSCNKRARPKGRGLTALRATELYAKVAVLADRGRDMCDQFQSLL